MAVISDNQIWSQALSELPSGIFSPLNCAEFREAWIEWYRDRADRRRRLTRRATRMQLAKLEPIGLAAALAAINRAIEGGWVTIYADEPSGAGKVIANVDKYSRWD